ncbi:PLD nuclease N-terminal domain-containing protein [Angustibacter luteus]|uniref:PLD nuclease N-terminal domain-containing protein n=1 Tax=Angustibacter luteus TaxID=658456 RepID=A0ABW1JCK5_9ACTN
MLRVVLYLVQLSLLVYCLIDCIQSDTKRVRNLPKIAWIILIVLIPLAGPIAWLIAGRPARDGGAPPWRPGTTGGPTRPSSAPRGPDDDPDFLRRLNPRPPAEPGDPSDSDPPAPDQRS